MLRGVAADDTEEAWEEARLEEPSMPNHYRHQVEPVRNRGWDAERHPTRSEEERWAREEEERRMRAAMSQLESENKRLVEEMKRLEEDKARLLRLYRIPESSSQATGSFRAGMTPSAVSEHLADMYDCLAAWASRDPLAVELDAWVAKLGAGDPSWLRFAGYVGVPQLAQVKPARYLGRLIVMAAASEWMYDTVLVERASAGGAATATTQPASPVPRSACWDDGFSEQQAVPQQHGQSGGSAAAELERLWLGGALSGLPPQPLPGCPEEVRTKAADLRRAVFSAAYERLVKGGQSSAEQLYGTLADALYGSVRRTLWDGAGDKHRQLPAEGKAQLAAAVRGAVLAGTLARAIGGGEDNGRSGDGSDGDGGGDCNLGFVRTDCQAHYKRTNTYIPVDEEWQRDERGFSAVHQSGRVPGLLLSLCPGYKHAALQGVKCYSRERVAVVRAM
ncbi:hypothetical protein GPECTOR_45g139 [Gonium pectorale]|uniref:Uncharacterized protein n=1 Tax=Gonium pectorale TaxID=33097 RepID=A0A150G8T5_GONPE|nr:hypothetical protein GPECTOR_45g139 [Gonium pectorale]|eukprot:KXZ46269.1 hypothetical protein GPECTOR_45g139 [Gonium pectorale]